ncbi:MAG: hypothetical protein J0M13_06790 [Candidatus Accumulibacter sp.]|jgi:hypothetical protein|nr:hypothetical protein [Candidatus Accumulibacter necessarius]
MRIRAVLAAAALAVMPLVASAQQPAVAEGLTAVGPGKFAGVVEARVTLVVDAIDKASRGVVLNPSLTRQ